HAHITPHTHFASLTHNNQPLVHIHLPTQAAIPYTPENQRNITEHHRTIPYVCVCVCEREREARSTFFYTVKNKHAHTHTHTHTHTLIHTPLLSSALCGG